MSDFYQNGIVTTLHNLRSQAPEKLEKELEQFSKKRSLGLVLPSLYSELLNPALKNIIQELAQVKYLNKIIIGLDQATKHEYRDALNFFSKLPQRKNKIRRRCPNQHITTRQICLYNYSYSGVLFLVFSEK